MSKTLQILPTQELFPRRASRVVIMLFLSLISAQGAFSQKITTEFDKAADFTKFKTFNIHDVLLTSANSVLNSDLVKKGIETEIERALTAKGMMRLTGPSDVDVWCQFGAVSREDVMALRGGGRGTGPSVVRFTTIVGTLVIDLRNSTTSSLVWRGVATEEQTESAKLQGKLEDMVEKAIAKYPPKK